MEFSIDVATLQRAIKVLAVSVRINAADSSGRILIETTESGVSFMANNGVVAMAFNATAEVHHAGVVSVAYSKIKSFISSYKPWDGSSGAKVFLFSTDGNKTKITVDNVYNDGKVANGELLLATANTALFSKAAEFGVPSFTLNSTIFRAATNKVLYAINPQTDYSQPALQGMEVQFEEDSIFFVGSDGVVLSEYRVKNVSNYIGENVTLQYEFIMGLRRLLSDDIPLLWEIKGNKINVKFEDIIFSGRRIIGHEFPEYKSAFDAYTDHLNLSKEFLIGSLYPFSDVLDPEDNFRLTLEIKDKILKIFNTQAKVEVEQDIVGGLDFSIDLNGKHLIQTIEAIKDDYILFKFSDDEGFAIFDSSTFNDQKALISPIKKR